MHTVNNLSPGVVETPRTDEPTPPIPDDISQRMSIPANPTTLPVWLSYFVPTQVVTSPTKPFSWMAEWDFSFND